MMKARYLLVAAIIAAIILYISSTIMLESRSLANVHTLPSLPKPIANEYALITSAGQSTDVYIVGDIANKFMIHNYFMPQAEAEDLEGINTLVFVVGYSSIGESLHDISYEDEKQRLEKLLQQARQKELVVITIFMGGKQQRNIYNDELLSILCQDTDYLIGTKKANRDGFLSELAKNNKIPITLVNGVDDISEPFTSIFR